VDDAGGDALGGRGGGAGVALKTEVAVQMKQSAAELTRLADGWPSRVSAIDPARAAVEEAAAILVDAADELTAPPMRARAGRR
jgi:hypothetical protein